MSTRARIIAAQAAAVAALVLVVYMTLLREDSSSPLPDIQAPGGQQVQGGPGGPDDGGGDDKNHKGRGDANGRPGLEGPAGTGTVIVGGPGWMGSFPLAPGLTASINPPNTPPTDQYADSVGRLLDNVGDASAGDDGTTSSSLP